VVWFVVEVLSQLDLGPTEALFVAVPTLCR
jgi:hypothetical protein